MDELRGVLERSLSKDDRPMLAQAAALLMDVSKERDPDRRRETFERLRELAIRTRQNLKRRGSLESPAESPLRERAAVVALNQAIGDPDRFVREQATWVAGSMGNSSTADALSKRLSDQDAGIRLAAVVSLSDIGGPAVAALLARLIGDSDQPEKVRFAALSSLEELVSKEFTSGPDRTLRGEPTSSRKGMRGRIAERQAPITYTSPVAVALKRSVQILDGDQKRMAFWRLKADEIIRYLSE